MQVDLVLNNATAYVEGQLKKASIAVNDGLIHRIGNETAMPKAESEIDLQDLVVLPGLIDSHVHLRDEGKADKEDFSTGTVAAAAGGFTTVLDMPNNQPVTMSGETLADRMKIAERKIFVNVGFFSEFPKQMDEIEKIVKLGAIGFKFFMAEQVGGVPVNDDQAIERAFAKTAKYKVPVAVHAEDAALLRENIEQMRKQKRNDPEAFEEAHSEIVEVKAVKRMLDRAKSTNATVHFCHVSTAGGLETIEQAKRMGLSVTCEATPHHLLLTDDDMNRCGTEALMMPPLRQKKHVEALWRGISNRSIDTIGSDHAPHLLKEKNQSIIWDVKVGIPGLETTLPLMLTQIARRRLAIADIVRLLSENPARIFGLRGKGAITPGAEADLTVVDIKADSTVDASRFKSKAKYSPFDEWKLKGKPAKTFVKGQLVMDNGDIVGSPGTGKLVKR